MNLSSINDNQNQSILLIDSSFDFNNLKKIINKKNIRVITFDYKSHTILENQNISHKLSEDYLTDDQYEQIQEYVYKFSYWYTNEKFSNYAWETNFGYGTKAHLDGLRKFGITAHHRKSFKPVHKILSR